jgi:hypothetical protein
MNIEILYEFLSGYFFPLLPFMIPARYLRKLERFLARVIGKAVAKWLKKFVKAFLTAVIGDPKEVGDRVGRWVRSRCSSDGDDASGAGGA